MKRKTSDLISSVFLIILSAAGLAECRNLSSSAAIMPTFTLVAILLLSAIQLIMLRKVPNESIEINFKRMGTVLALLLVYVLAMDMIGYYVCTYLFVLGIMWAFGVRKTKSFFLIPAAFCLFVWIVFAKGLSISLPEGLLI